jgi:serine/threonine-protein kinase
MGFANATVGEERGLFAGRYRIDSVLGTGGMGIVYAATHVELGLPVAIKIIHPTLADSAEARARFAIEARAGAALRSPHTIRVYDAGQLGVSQSYVVMERLEGTNLGALLQAKGALPVETAVEYVLQACTALSEAHSIGVIHRDIKPENLFLAQSRNAAPLIKLLDFGIARWVGDEFLSGRITNPRSSLGSPCYQSPEQMENAPDLDERSDIWSLGLVLFELLTGYCPFEADSIQETCWKVLQGPRPSLCAARPGIDPRLGDVIDRCLALDRSKRFSSVRQLIVALKPFAPRAIETVDPTATPPVRPLPLTQLRRRGSRVRLVALAAVLTLGAGLTAFLHPDARGLGRVVQSTSSSAFVQASSALRGLTALASLPAAGK